MFCAWLLTRPSIILECDQLAICIPAVFFLPQRIFHIACYAEAEGMKAVHSIQQPSILKKSWSTPYPLTYFCVLGRIQIKCVTCSRSSNWFPGRALMICTIQCRQLGASSRELAHSSWMCIIFFTVVHQGNLLWGWVILNQKNSKSTSLCGHIWYDSGKWYVHFQLLLIWYWFWDRL